MPQVQENKKYIYQDYLQWDDDERWELIDGVSQKIENSPIIIHQAISMNVMNCFAPQLQKLQSKLYYPFSAPVDVVFSDYDVVRPDIFEKNQSS